jgi:hypothetical protein
MNLELGWDGLGRIVRSKDQSKDVSAQDEVHINVKLLPILSDAQMRELLRKVLQADGWRQQADGSLSKNVDGVEAVLPAEGSELVLRAKQNTSVTVTQRGYFEKDASDEEVDKALSEQAAAALEQAAKREQERVSREVVARLLGVEPSMREQLQTALNKVYREALEQRAKQLGELEWVREQGSPDGSYEVTLVVKA